MKWLFAPLLLLLTVACGNSPSPRDRAALRGLRFLEQVADNPAHFEENGDDLMWAFYTISEAASDPALKAEARAFGHKLAREWRAAHPKLPSDASPDLLYLYASASSSADDLGVPNEAMKQEIDRAARRYTPVDFLLFDPAREPVPLDVPEPCKRCRERNQRGAKVCHKCKGPLAMKKPYDIFYDALITTYAAHHYGIWMGGEFADVVQWIPKLRPWAVNADSTYTITHIVYTLNDYSLFQLKPEWLPQEFAYLRKQAQSAIDGNDPETLGEFLDSLQAFGVSDQDPQVRRGIDYLMTHQNADGSWGDVHDKDIYARYHTTWTGIGGVMRYAWRGVRVTDEKALAKLLP